MPKHFEDYVDLEGLAGRLFKRLDRYALKTDDVRREPTWRVVADLAYMVFVMFPAALLYKAAARADVAVLFVWLWLRYAALVLTGPFVGVWCGLEAGWLIDRWWVLLTWPVYVLTGAIVVTAGRVEKCRENWQRCFEDPL